MKPYLFGERMKQFRLRRKLSQTQMGKLLDVHYIQIGRYESGKAIPSVDTLVWMSKKLKVSVDYLLFGEQAQTHMPDPELFYLLKQLLTLGPQDRIDAKKMIGDFIAERKRPAGTI